MANPLDDLARRILRLERRQFRANTQPQLGHSSIEDGRIEEWYGDTQGMVIGAQHDGTHVAASVTGPKPITPSAPALTPVPGGLNIKWDGTWEDPLGVASMDFLRVDIVVSVNPGFDPVATPPQASLVSPRGGEIFLALSPVEHYVALVARSIPGKASDHSEIVAATPLAAGGDGGPDGQTPEASGAPTVIGGIDALHVRWPGVVNADPVEYEVHVSNTDAFTPTSDTLYSTTSATSETVKRAPVEGFADIAYNLIEGGDLTEDSTAIDVSVGELTVDTPWGIYPDPGNVVTYYEAGGPDETAIFPEMGRPDGPYVEFSTSDASDPVWIWMEHVPFATSSDEAHQITVSYWIWTEGATGAQSYNATYVWSDDYTVDDWRDLPYQDAHAGWTQVVETFDIPAGVSELHLGIEYSNWENEATENRYRLANVMVAEGSAVAPFTGATGPTGPEGASGFRYDTDYYVKIVARDADGPAPPSPAGTGRMVQATGIDIAADSVTSREIAAGSIYGETLAGEIILGSKIKTSEAGQRVEIDSEGIRLVASDDSAYVNLPTQSEEDAVFRGEVWARGLTIEQGATFRSPQNEIASDSGLTLNTSVSTPLATPSVHVGHDSFPLEIVSAPGSLGTFALDPNEISGFHMVYSGMDRYKICQRRGSSTRVWIYNLDGSFRSVAGDYDMLFTGSLWATDARSIDLAYNGDWWLWDSTVGIWNKVNISSAGDRAALGYDPVNDHIWVVDKYATSGRMRARRMRVTGDPDSWASVDEIIIGNATDGFAGNPNSFLIGEFDHTGTQRAYIGSHGNTEDIQAFVPSSMNHAPNYDFASPSARKRGTLWDGSQFLTVCTDGRIYKHSAMSWTSGTDRLYYGMTWYDSDPAGGGQHETTLSAKKYVTLQKRATARFTFPPIPDYGAVDDPDSWRLYVARSTSVPDDSEMSLETSNSTQSYIMLSLPSEAGAPPPVTNNFPGATPGYVRSGDLDGSGNPKLDLRGDGSARIGDLEVDSSGKATVTTPAEIKGEVWHEVGAAGEPPYESGWSRYNDDYAAAFKKDAVGGIHLTGRATGSSGVIFHLPQGYRIRSDSSYPVTDQNGNVARLNLFTDGRVHIGGNSGDWVNLGVYFPSV